MGSCGCGNQLALADQDFISAGDGISINGHVQNPGIRINTWSASGWRRYNPGTILGIGGSLFSDTKYRFNGVNVIIYISLRFTSSTTFTGAPFEFSLPSNVFEPFYGAGGYLGNDGIIGQWSIFNASAGTYLYGPTYLGIQPTDAPLRARWGNAGEGVAASSQVSSSVFSFAADDEFVATYEFETV